MTLRYTNRPVGYAPKQTEDWRRRFPANALPIDSAPALGSRPVRVFNASAGEAWCLKHGDQWKIVQNVLDADGIRRPRMTGDVFSGAVMWASS